MGHAGRRGGECPAPDAAHGDRLFLLGARVSGGRCPTTETAHGAAGLQAAALYAGAFSPVLSGRLGRASRRTEEAAGLAGRGQRCSGFGQPAARGAEAATEGAQVSGRSGGGEGGAGRPVLEGNLRRGGAGGVVDGFPGAPRADARTIQSV